MITLGELKQYALKKGLHIEIEYPQSYAYKYTKEPINNFNHNDTSFRVRIGFQFKNGVYYWWNGLVIDEPITDDLVMMFEHRYNQMNGATQKAWKKGYKAEEQILEFLNK